MVLASWLWEKSHDTEYVALAELCVPGGLGLGEAEPLLGGLGRCRSSGRGQGVFVKGARPVGRGGALRRLCAGRLQCLHRLRDCRRISGAGLDVLKVLLCSFHDRRCLHLSLPSDTDAPSSSCEQLKVAFSIRTCTTSLCAPV